MGVQKKKPTTYEKGKQDGAAEAANNIIEHLRSRIESYFIGSPVRAAIEHEVSVIKREYLKGDK